MSRTEQETAMIYQIDEEMRKLDIKLKALNDRKKRATPKKSSKKCIYPIREIGSAFNYLNHTIAHIGDDFHTCLMNTDSGRDAKTCLHTLTHALSDVNCNKVTNAMKHCNNTDNIPASTLQCLHNADTTNQVDLCIGKSLDIKLSSHIAKGKKHVQNKLH